MQLYFQDDGLLVTHHDPSSDPFWTVDLIDFVSVKACKRPGLAWSGALGGPLGERMPDRCTRLQLVSLINKMDLGLPMKMFPNDTCPSLDLV